MFILQNAARSIKRQPKKAALYFIVCAVATLTLQIYIADVDRTQRQLDSLPDAMPVTARVASLDGSWFDALQISEKTIDGLQGSAFVEDLRMSVYFLIGFAEKGMAVNEYVPYEEYYEEYVIPKELWNNILFRDSIGINCLEAYPMLPPESIAWLPGYGSDMFATDEKVCVIRKDFMDEMGYSLGDDILIEAARVRYGQYGGSDYENLYHTELLRIVGVADTTEALFVAVPFETVRTFYANRAGIRFAAASASFAVSDSLRLNEFKEEMLGIQLEPASSDDRNATRIMANQGTSLLVDDATFISAATRLQEKLSLIRAFFPLLAATLVIVGYLVAYLAIQSRREEFALYRLLGLGKASGFCLFFAEIAALTIGGSIVGALISSAAGFGGIGIVAAVFALFSACFLLGATIALLRLCRTNVMLALAKND